MGSSNSSIQQQQQQQQLNKQQKKSLSRDPQTLKPANDIVIVITEKNIIGVSSEKKPIHEKRKEEQQIFKQQSNQQPQQEQQQTSKIPKIKFHDASTRKLNSNSNTSLTSSKQTIFTENTLNKSNFAKEMTKTEDTSNKQTKPEAKKRTALYTENLPTFYVGAGNNAELIIDIMKKLGWEQVFEKNEDTYKFKWVQSTRSVNWNSFKEGEQIVNHIPNCSLFTNKLNLLCNLQAYEKAQMALQNKPAHFMPLEDYLPLTYKLDDRVDRETFFSVAKEDELWICKPVSMNQGRGIYLIRSPHTLRQKLEQHEDGQNKKFGLNKPVNRIIQKYIHNPLLINKRKFDIRCYMLIASTKPLIVFFHHGYLRLSMHEFTNEDDNLVTHLTNQFFQKKDPKYKEIKEDTTWSMEQFNDYINKTIAPRKNLPKDWVFNQFTKTMHQIMLQVIHSVRHKLKRKIGYFGVYGYDFMIDDDLKTYLIEINVNPAITTNTDILIQAIPPAISEGIQISIECWEKARSNKKIFPLSSVKDYMLLYNETTSASAKAPGLGERSPTFARRSISSSPTNKPPPSIPSASRSIDITTNSQRSKSEGQSLRIPMSKSSDFRAKQTRTIDNNGNSNTKQQHYLDKISEESSKNSVKHKLRYSSAKLKPIQTSPPGVELKPATVEVFFRTAPTNQLTKNELVLKQIADKKASLVGHKNEQQPQTITTTTAVATDELPIIPTAITTNTEATQQKLNESRSVHENLLLSPYKAAIINAADYSKHQQQQHQQNAEKYFSKTKHFHVNQTTALIYQLAKSRLAKSMFQSHSTSNITKLPLINSQQQQKHQQTTRSLVYKLSPNKTFLLKPTTKHNDNSLSAPVKTNIVNIMRIYRI